MSLGQRLRAARLKKELTQDAVAAKVGITFQALSNYERDVRDPDTDILTRLASLYGVSADYLLGRDDVIAELPGAYLPGDTVRLPVLGTIKAGQPIIAINEIIGYELVDKKQINNGDFFFLRVSGDSMIGSRICDGDIALIEKQSAVNNGQIAVVLINGEEATLKKVYSVNGHVMLHSDNPNYEPMVYPAEDVTILGRVVEVRIKTKL